MAEPTAPEGRNIVTVPWNDNTTDNFYLDFTDITSGVIAITSDSPSKVENNALERSRILTIKGKMGSQQSTVYLNITQKLQEGDILSKFVQDTNITQDSIYGKSN